MLDAPLPSPCVCVCVCVCLCLSVSVCLSAMSQRPPMNKCRLLPQSLWSICVCGDCFSFVSATMPSTPSSSSKKKGGKGKKKGGKSNTGTPNAKKQQDSKPRLCKPGKLSRPLPPGSVVIRLGGGAIERVNACPLFSISCTLTRTRTRTRTQT